MIKFMKINPILAGVARVHSFLIFHLIFPRMLQQKKKRKKITISFHNSALYDFLIFEEAVLLSDFINMAEFASIQNNIRPLTLISFSAATFTTDHFATLASYIYLGF